MNDIKCLSIEGLSECSFERVMIFMKNAMIIIVKTCQECANWFRRREARLFTYSSNHCLEQSRFCLVVKVLKGI